MKLKKAEASNNLSTMDRLYDEVNYYNSDQGKKKRRVKKGFLIALDVLFASFVAVLSYFIVIVNLAKSNNNVPFFFGYSVEYVETGSMIPSLPVGSVIVSKKVDNSTKINVGYKDTASEGNIITFYDADRIIVTHRAVESYVTSGKEFYITKGDNNSSIDPNPIPREDVLSIFLWRII